jgi:hypothetical protein
MIKTREEIIATTWFPRHEVTFHTKYNNETEVLRWQEPGTSVYLVEYVRRHGTLMVRGDIGEAVYGWHQSIGDMESMANTSFDYFHSKCCASEYGRDFTHWDSVSAWDDLNEALELKASEAHEPKIALALLKARVADLNRFGDPLQDEHEAYAWIHDHAHELLGDHWHEYFHGFGKKISFRCTGHWMGLRMAFGVEDPRLALATTTQENNL